MSAERHWPDFEWSPEAIEDAMAAFRATSRTGGNPILAALSAAVKAQPVVALADAAALRRERDDAILERDEMRRANITPDDAARPPGQSIEYWQDKALDLATWGDHKCAEAQAATRELKALQAQPVVALPPCPTCNGNGYTINMRLSESCPTCPACNGSGVERMVPLSEIVAWLRKAPHGHWFGDPEDRSFALHDRGWFADAVERQFGGSHAN